MIFTGLDAVGKGLWQRSLLQSGIFLNKLVSLSIRVLWSVSFYWIGSDWGDVFFNFFYSHFCSFMVVCGLVFRVWVLDWVFGVGVFSWLGLGCFGFLVGALYINIKGITLWKNGTAKVAFGMWGVELDHCVLLWKWGNNVLWNLILIIIKFSHSHFNIRHHDVHVATTEASWTRNQHL